VILSHPSEISPDLRGSIMLLGNFDGFHRGHQHLLAFAQAKARAEGRPLGAMSAEPHPRQFFAPDAAPFRLTCPITKHQTFRRSGFDFVFSPTFDADFACQDPEEFVAAVLVNGLGVSRVVTGRNFRFGARRSGDTRLLRELGLRYGFTVSELDELRVNDRICGSSIIRQHIQAGDMAAASALLGYPWHVALRITTASNPVEIAWPKHVLRPPPGSYGVAIRPIGDTLQHSPAILFLSEDGVADRLELSSAQQIIHDAAISGLILAEFLPSPSRTV